MKRGLTATAYLILVLACAAVIVLATVMGSVTVPLSDSLAAVRSFLAGADVAKLPYGTIVTGIRLPRVLNVFLVGASLSLAGASMQGLLKNPLADGSTLGVTAGASLGAALAIAFSAELSIASTLGVTGMAMLFALLSLVAVLQTAYSIDHSLATNTVILTGVVLSMLANALISLVITFAGERTKSILFWTMGSLSGTGYSETLLLAAFLIICGGILLLSTRELNAFAIGEENAHSIGVNVTAVRIRVLLTVSALVGATVSVAGCIGFVGLVVPQAIRRITGPNHERLLPASIFVGGGFLVLCDLVGRTILPPMELPIGVITSLIGAVTFIVLLSRTGRRA